MFTEYMMCPGAKLGDKSERAKRIYYRRRRIIIITVVGNKRNDASSVLKRSFSRPFHRRRSLIIARAGDKHEERLFTMFDLSFRFAGTVRVRRFQKAQDFGAL